MKTDVKFKNKEIDANKAKYKLKLFEFFFKNYVESLRSKKICIKQK